MMDIKKDKKLEKENRVLLDAKKENVDIAVDIKEKEERVRTETEIWDEEYNVLKKENP